jgi:hypothetical protein
MRYPRRWQHGNEPPDAGQRVHKSECVECPWGGDRAELSTDDTEVEQLFAIKNVF